MKVGVLAIFMAIVLPFAAAAGPVADSDSDGTLDAMDICVCDAQVPAPCGLDTDSDGFGNRCDGDFTQDGVVTAADAPAMIAALGTGVPTAVGTDMNCDGVVTAGDAGLFIAQLNQGVPGPSGVAGSFTPPCP